MGEEEKKEAAPTGVETKAPAAAGGKKKVSWALVLILSILFGQLGIDRFIMGQALMGILKLITAGGCGIWWIIDVILIATKNDFGGTIEWTD